MEEKNNQNSNNIKADNIIIPENEENLKTDSTFFYKKEEKTKKNYISLIATILKLLIALIVTLLISNYLSSIISRKIVEKDLTGLWGDEYGNYYEIYNNKFCMNVGNPDLTFYEGEIKNITKTDTGYKLFIKGKKYSIENNTRTYEKDMKMTFEIINYTNELKKQMTANIGIGEYKIIRLEDSINHNK